MSDHVSPPGEAVEQNYSEYLTAINRFVDVRNELANVLRQYQCNGVTDAKRIKFIVTQIDNLDKGLRYFDNGTVTELLLDISKRLRLQSIVVVESFLCLVCINGKPHLFCLTAKE